LTEGPYEKAGKIPLKLVGRRLTDDETASAVAFIHSYVVNSFQGCLAEILAAVPCLRIVREQQEKGIFPPHARIYVGDVVTVGLPDRKGKAKGPDLHILFERDSSEKESILAVAGLVEVKSYHKSSKQLLPQLGKHMARVGLGLRVGTMSYPPERVKVGFADGGTPLRIEVVPDRWKLPRTFHFEKKERRELLLVDPAIPPFADDRIVPLSDTEWRVTLRWSHEALAAAAYKMAFWYMEKLGEVVYKAGVPPAWSEMTPAEAGVNAAKMMLYYAILRAQTRGRFARAVALYNTYGFGYALGMNFKDKKGVREMLWPEDLREILETGKTKHNCRIVE
jgi:hypothetical protein